jgi:acyl-CoA thioester hydrolase
MMLTRKAPYFKAESMSDGSPAPPPLCCTVERTARFEEVDPLNVVWHGRYPSYFEDARVAFGDAYNLSYLDFYKAGLVVFIKQMAFDYVQPLRFAQTCRITATLHWSEAARLNFSYVITDLSGTVLTTGYTVQLFLNTDMELFMVKPDFYANFCSLWKNGKLTGASGANG